MRRPLCWLAAAFFLILCIIVQKRNWRDSVPVLPQENLVLTGKIIEKTEKKQGRLSNWELVLEQVSYEENNEKVILEGNYLLKIFMEEAPLLGQRIRAEAKISPWEGVSNPGQFDVGKWYHSQGIMGQFKNGRLLNKTGEYSFFREGLWQFRQDCLSLLLKNLGEKEGSVRALSEKWYFPCTCNFRTSSDAFRNGDLPNIEVFVSLGKGSRTILSYSNDSILYFFRKFYLHHTCNHYVYVNIDS